MSTKTMLALSTAIVLAGSSAAVAMAKNPDGRTSARPAFAQGAPVQNVLRSGVSSNVVIAEGKVIGQDSDPNVRLQLRRDYWSKFGF